MVIWIRFVKILHFGVLGVIEEYRISTEEVGHHIVMSFYISAFEMEVLYSYTPSEEFYALKFSRFVKKQT